MDIPRDATNVILTLKLVDGDGVLIEGVAFDDGDLSVTSKPYNGAEAAVTLIAGTIGSFTANSWVETARAGYYQFCPANELIVAGRPTIFFFDYAANPSVEGVINAVGNSGNTVSVVGINSGVFY